MKKEYKLYFYVILGLHNYTQGSLQSQAVSMPSKDEEITHSDTSIIPKDTVADKIAYFNNLKKDEQKIETSKPSQLSIDKISSDRLSHTLIIQPASQAIQAAEKITVVFEDDIESSTCPFLCCLYNNC